MFREMGHSGFGVYIFFGAMQILAIFYVLFLLPDTKGVPLEFMDQLFDYKRPITAHGRVMKQVEQEHAAYESGEPRSYLKPSGEHNLFENAKSGNGQESPDEHSLKA